MKFGKKTQINSLAINEQLVSNLYDDEDNSDFKSLLSNIVRVFEPHIGEVEGDFTCFVEKAAMNAFEKFANEVYRDTENEATGIIVGYYLHDKDNPDKKIIVATNFLEATGSASNVTCEFSYEDSIRHSRFCDDKKVLPIIWIHSHPGFGVFYSSTDSSTLKNYFNCNHQMGIVVDNLRKKYLGFKIYNGEQYQQDFFIFDIENCLDKGALICERWNDSNEESTSKKKRTVSYKELSKLPSQTTTNKHSSSISYQLLQKISKQLNALEKDNSVEKLRNSIEELNKFLKELKTISAMPFDTGGHYSTTDIKDEITNQIKEIIQGIENNITSLRSDFQAFILLKDDIQSLKDEVTELKKGVYSSDQNVGMESQLNKIESILGEIINKINYNTIGNDTFIESFKNPFNIRDLVFCLIFIFAFILYLFRIIVIKL